MKYLTLLICLCLLAGCQKEKPFIFNGDFSETSIVHQSQPEEIQEDTYLGEIDFTTTKGTFEVSQAHPIEHCCPVCGSCERETFKDMKWVDEYYTPTEDGWSMKKDPTGNINLPSLKEFDDDRFIRAGDYNFYICANCGNVYSIKAEELK